jgi:hypothetical protein
LTLSGSSPTFGKQSEANVFQEDGPAWQMQPSE